MLLRTEVTHATDLDLLTVLIGDRKKATQLFAKASFSLFALLHTQPHRNGDLFCALHRLCERPGIKLQAATELATRTSVNS